MNVSSFNRTLDQELVALARSVSFECPECGEFVLHVQRDILCRECGLAMPGLLAGGTPQTDVHAETG